MCDQFLFVPNSHFSFTTPHLFLVRERYSQLPLNFTHTHTPVQMSEAHPRRGGSARPSRRSPQQQQNPSSTQPSAPMDEETKRLKSKYSSALSTLRELFPDWKDEDLLAVLAETDGDIENSVVRITEGHASQWGEVKKKSKDRSKSKGPDANVDAPKGATKPATRGARSERGRSRVPKKTTNGHAAAKPANTTEQQQTTTPSTWAGNEKTAAPAPGTWASALGKRSAQPPVAEKQPQPPQHQEQQPEQQQPQPQPSSNEQPTSVTTTTNDQPAPAPSGPKSWAAVAAPPKKVVPAVQTRQLKRTNNNNSRSHNSPLNSCHSKLSSSSSLHNNNSSNQNKFNASTRKCRSFCLAQLTELTSLACSLVV